MSKRTKVLGKLDVISFACKAGLLHENNWSLAQRAAVKAIYGLPLDDEEMVIYRKATGRSEYPRVEQDEATFICGRRAGKTSRVACGIAIFEAFRLHGVPTGEHAYIAIVAPVKRQAKIAFRFLRNFLLDSPLLKKYVLKIHKDEIELSNGVIIACWPCNLVTVRGSSVICAILDEVAFWQHEETSANPEAEVLDALRPSMATLSNTKLIKISTPFRKEGLLWDEYQRRNELGHFVWQLSSAEMNPSISAAFLEKQRNRGEEKFRREYLAEFTDHVSRWINSNVLDACIAKGTTELPPRKGVRFVAAVDPAFKRDDFALCIAERANDGTISLALLRTWTGKPNEPLGFEAVCREIARILKSYGINTLVGDQHCAAVIAQAFLKLGINYREFTFTTASKMDLFTNVKHLLLQRQIQLLDDPELLRQLRGLEEHRTSSGNVEIRTAARVKDDLVCATVLAAYELSNQNVDVRTLVPSLGYVEQVKHRYGDPLTCRYGAVCANHPRCVDRDRCLGFVRRAS